MPRWASVGFQLEPAELVIYTGFTLRLFARVQTAETSLFYGPWMRLIQAACCKRSLDQTATPIGSARCRLLSATRDDTHYGDSCIAISAKWLATYVPSHLHIRIHNHSIHIGRYMCMCRCNCRYVYDDLPCTTIIRSSVNLLTW